MLTAEQADPCGPTCIQFLLDLRDGVRVGGPASNIRTLTMKRRQGPFKWQPVSPDLPWRELFVGGLRFRSGCRHRVLLQAECGHHWQDSLFLQDLPGTDRFSLYFQFTGQTLVLDHSSSRDKSLIQANSPKCWVAILL